MSARPFLLGLTGSMGMGKSTTANFFAEAGVPVWDADKAVHDIYAPGGAGAGALSDLAGQAIVVDGAVDRDALRRAVVATPDLLPRIEARIHPIVAADRAAFLKANAAADLVLCDIPLLYETDADRWLDAVLVVTAAEDVQRARVLDRPGMNREAFDRIAARQTPDAEKRARADYIIETDRGLEAARRDVLSLIARIRQEQAHA